MHLGSHRRRGLDSAEDKRDARAVHKSHLAEVEAEYFRSLKKDGAVDSCAHSGCRVVIYLTAYSRDKRCTDAREFHDFIVHFELLVFCLMIIDYSKANLRILSLLRGEKYFF